MIHAVLRVHHATHSWPLGAREARITANVSAMVDDAARRGEATSSPAAGGG